MAKHRVHMQAACESTQRLPCTRSGLRLDRRRETRVAHNIGSAARFRQRRASFSSNQCSAAVAHARRAMWYAITTDRRMQLVHASGPMATQVRSRRLLDGIGITVQPQGPVFHMAGTYQNPSEYTNHRTCGHHASRSTPAHVRREERHCDAPFHAWRARHSRAAQSVTPSARKCELATRDILLIQSGARTPADLRASQLPGAGCHMGHPSTRNRLRHVTSDTQTPPRIAQGNLGLSITVQSRSQRSV